MRIILATIVLSGSLLAQTATFSVSESNFAYFIDGQGPNPPLEIYKDSTYVFQGSSIPTDHPFAISTSSSTVNVPAGVSAASITGNAPLTFTPASSGTFFYVCTVHFFFGRITVIDASTTHAGTDNAETPGSFHLHPSYPNPFNPTTQVRFDLPERSHIRLSILNTLGQTVEVIVQETRSPGTHRATWNANAPTGVYYWKLEATSLDSEKRFVSVQRVVLIR